MMREGVGTLRLRDGHEYNDVTYRRIPVTDGGGGTVPRVTVEFEVVELDPTDKVLAWADDPTALEGAVFVFEDGETRRIALLDPASGNPYIRTRLLGE
jgi:hypothetical protein